MRNNKPFKISILFCGIVSISAFLFTTTCVNAQAIQSQNGNNNAPGGFKIRTVTLKPEAKKAQHTYKIEQNKMPSHPKTVVKVQKSTSISRPGIKTKIQAVKQPVPNTARIVSEPVTRKSAKVVKPTQKPVAKRKEIVKVAGPEQTQSNGVYNQNLDDMYKDKSVPTELNKSLKKKEPSIFSTFPALGIVLALILITYWILSKIKGVNPATIFEGKLGEKTLNSFKILTSASLGQGRNLHLVEINEKKLVVGSTANNINMLAELESKELNNKQSPQEILQEYQYSNQYQDNEAEFIDPDNYSARYPDLYQEYLKENIFTDKDADPDKKKKSKKDK